MNYTESVLPQLPLYLEWYKFEDSTKLKFFPDTGRYSCYIVTRNPIRANGDKGCYLIEFKDSYTKEQMNIHLPLFIDVGIETINRKIRENIILEEPHSPNT